MGLAFAQAPLVALTTVAPLASGAFIGLAIAFLTSEFTREQLRRIDRWTLAPLAVLAAAYLIAYPFLDPAQRVVGIGAVQGVGWESVPFVSFMGTLFATLAAVYWIIALTGGLPYGARRVFAVVVAAASLTFSLAMGLSYAGSGVATWNSPLVPLGLVGLAAAGGVPLGVLVIALAGGLPAVRAPRFASASIAVAFAGSVAALASIVSQLLFAQSVHSVYYTGAEALPNSWAYLVVIVAGFAAMLACLRSALAPENRSVAPIGRSVAAAATARWDGVGTERRSDRSTTSTLFVGAAAALAAAFVARLMFYLLQF